MEKTKAIFLPMPETIEVNREATASPMDRPLTLKELSVNPEYSAEDDGKPEASPSTNQSDLFVRATQQPNDVTNTSRSNDGTDQTRQIRYYHDRIDFRGDILLKPPAAKSSALLCCSLAADLFLLLLLDCRILWEFLFLLLEDSNYESVILWENREKMIFRIIQADKLAALWGK